MILTCQKCHIDDISISLPATYIIESEGLFLVFKQALFGNNG